jgi:hypothetical protein
MRIAGWIFLVAGIVVGAYGKYFFDPPYRVYGIAVAMIGATLLLWRKRGREYRRHLSNE